MSLFDRMSLRPVALDYWRSLRIHPSGKPDVGARALLTALPLMAAGATVWRGFVVPQPTALLPAASLLAGVLLASSGQILTLRARVADSVVLSGDRRVTSHIRETISGIVLAAVVAMLDALVLGSLTLFAPAQHHRPAVAVSAVAAALTTFLALMFLVTARRLYATFLEAFENGSPLPKPSRTPRRATNGEAVQSHPQAPQAPITTEQVRHPTR